MSPWCLCQRSAHAGSLGTSTGFWVPLYVCPSEDIERGRVVVFPQAGMPLQVGATQLMERLHGSHAFRKPAIYAASHRVRWSILENPFTPVQIGHPRSADSFCESLHFVVVADLCSSCLHFLDVVFQVLLLTIFVRSPAMVVDTLVKRLGSEVMLLPHQHMLGIKGRGGVATVVWNLPRLESLHHSDGPRSLFAQINAEPLALFEGLVQQLHGGLIQITRRFSKSFALPGLNNAKYLSVISFQSRVGVVRTWWWRLWHPGWCSASELEVLGHVRGIVGPDLLRFVAGHVLSEPFLLQLCAVQLLAGVQINLTLEERSFPFSLLS
mmetsp:Transcript_23993/g.56474  ORF Transcript_23993/g.56474 Transcript_23993/m.56474 type:complete len:324 (+) Transcript_23993:282-1253(+)